MIKLLKALSLFHFQSFRACPGRGPNGACAAVKNQLQLLKTGCTNQKHVSGIKMAMIRWMIMIHV